MLALPVTFPFVCYPGTAAREVALKFIIVAGARPNFMKIAPIMAAFAKLSSSLGKLSLSWSIPDSITTEQMSDNFFADLEIPKPDINLGVGSGTHAEQTARVMVAFEEVCLEDTGQTGWLSSET